MRHEPVRAALKSRKRPIIILFSFEKQISILGIFPGIRVKIRNFRRFVGNFCKFSHAADPVQRGSGSAQFNAAELVRASLYFLVCLLIVFECGASL